MRSEMMWSVWNNSFLNCSCRWEWRMIIAVSFPIKAVGKNWIVSLSGIHIPSHPVVLDDYNLIQTIKITSKVALRTSEVLLNHKIFSKILIWFYTFSLCSDYFSDPLKNFRMMENTKQLLAPSLMVRYSLRKDRRLSFLWSTALRGHS